MNEDQDCSELSEHRHQLSNLVGEAPAYHMRAEHVGAALARVNTVIWYAFLFGAAVDAGLITLFLAWHQ